MLINFPHLQKLEVLTPDETELEFGYNFSKLTQFKSNCRWDEKKLAAFSQKAPQLEIFVFLTGSLHRHKNKKAREMMSFPKLHLLKFYLMYHIDPDPVINLIRSTKVLTHIYIEEDEAEMKESIHNLYENINDKVIAAAAPSLKKLVCFHAHIKRFRGMTKFSMTRKSVYSLLNNCPDLTDIGNVFHWDIPHKEVLELKKEAKEKNWMVNLIPADNL